MRLLDRNNYYLVRANAFEGNVRFYKVVAGRRIQLAGADIPVTAGVRHDLAVNLATDPRSAMSARIAGCRRANAAPDLRPV